MCVYSEDVLKCEREPRVHESPKGSVDSNVPALCSRCSDGWIKFTRCSNLQQQGTRLTCTSNQILILRGVFFVVVFRLLHKVLVEANTVKYSMLLSLLDAKLLGITV